MTRITTLLLIISGFVANGQQRIDSSFAFQTDPNKKYSIYVPSSYSASTPNRMMLALHPWNTARWNAISWCDTLTNFAEANGLLLICPDGGADGQVDDAIDTAFTSAILDSMELWYNVDTEKVYAMGFSWGGLTTYTYGLNHVDRFGGFMPIGAAINGAGVISSYASNANGKAFYVIHGSQDNPGTRYTPLINSLTTNGAILNSLLMSGVGHTIDFPNRNQILTDAYIWIDSVNCAGKNTSIDEQKGFKSIEVFPNPVKRSNDVDIDVSSFSGDRFELSVIDLSGREVLSAQLDRDGESHLVLPVGDLGRGSYLLLLSNDHIKAKTNLIIAD